VGSAGFYINLDRSTDRRSDMEGQFDRYDLGALYERFPAADGNALGLPNPTLSDAEIGCFTSHYLLLKECLGKATHIHVLEDDVVLSEATRLIVDLATSSRLLDDHDLVFTNTALWFSDLRDCRRLFDQAEITRDASGKIVSFHYFLVPYRSTMSSYIVNARSIPKILNLYEEELHRGARSPIDLFLRSKIVSGALKSACVFPFCTTVNIEHVSTIAGRAGNTTSRFASNMLRQLFFVNRDLERLLELARGCLPVNQEDTFNDLLGLVLTFITSPQYTPF